MRERNYLNRDLSKKRSPDKLTKIERSARMSKIRSNDTKFERDFITALKKKTRKKFKLNVTSIRGKPDIVFMREKVCVFLDSDFWHGWQYPRWKHLLKNKFWTSKIENNRRRDTNTTNYLRRSRWKVLRIWGHEILQKEDMTLMKVVKFLKK